MEINSKQLLKTQIIESEIKAIWKKWTTHEGLKTFFGLENKIELRPGGAFEIFFLLDNPKGTRGGEGNQVLSFLPEEMLSFTWNAPPTIPEVRNHPHRTWVVITLEALAQERTKVTLKHVGWLDGEKWDETFDYFDRAWDLVLKSLQESCKP